MAAFGWGTVTIRSGTGVHVVVPKKVFPRAVDRNRAKRRVRAALQKVTLPKAMIRVNPSRPVLTVAFATIVQDIAHALK